MIIGDNAKVTIICEDLVKLITETTWIVQRVAETLKELPPFRDGQKIVDIFTDMLLDVIYLGEIQMEEDDDEVYTERDSGEDQPQ